MGSHFLEVHELHSTYMVEMIGTSHCRRYLSLSANWPYSFVFSDGYSTEKRI